MDEIKRVFVNVQKLSEKDIEEIQRNLVINSMLLRSKVENSRVTRSKSAKMGIKLVVGMQQKKKPYERTKKIEGKEIQDTIQHVIQPIDVSV